MRFIPILVFLTMIPAITFSQMHFTENVSQEEYQSHPVLISQNLHVVTPVLLRGSSYHIQKEFSVNRTYRPGLSFAGSALIPGTGQMMNRNWVRSGLYLAVEATAIYFAIDYRNQGKKGEQRYERFADNNWSVVQYSRWLVDYHDVHKIQNPSIEALRNLVENIEPAFDVNHDWNSVDLNVLRSVERNTPYLTTDDLAASNFSHSLPSYGSQQYYELISKYYQYQAGWRDYDEFHDSLGNTGEFYYDRYLIERNGAFASSFFFHGAGLANTFNQDYRWSRHFISLLIANHFISAFDAYFTAKTKQNRLQTSSSIIPGKQVVIRYHF